MSSSALGGRERTPDLWCWSLHSCEPHLTWVLGTGLMSSVRAVCLLTAELPVHLHKKAISEDSKTTSKNPLYSGYQRKAEKRRF